jgi:hypothetical protein
MLLDFGDIGRHSSGNWGADDLPPFVSDEKTALEDGQILYCLKVGENVRTTAISGRNMQYALVLRKVEGTDNHYERVGFFKNEIWPWWSETMTLVLV